MKRLHGAFLVVVLLIAVSGCEMKAALFKQDYALEENGDVYLYLQPFPQEAQRLKFTVENISAVRDDGTEYPLSLALTGLDVTVVKRQRLFAAGQLPPGSYRGFSIRVGKATMKTEEGEATLLLPNTAARLEYPFSVQRKKGTLIAMSFRYAESLKGGFSFSPAFTFFIPQKPLLSLTCYVTNYDAHSITVIEKKTWQARQIIETGKGPMGIAIDAKARRAYVALSGEDAIEVIDMIASDTLNRLLLQGGDRPQEVILTPDGRTLLSANTGSNTVSIIDPITLVEKKRLKVGNGPNSLLLDRTGRRAFVFNTVSSTISVIDIPNQAVIATISTEAGPLRGQLSRRGDRLYVIFERSPYLVVLDAMSFSVLNRMMIGPSAFSMKVDTDTDFIYLGRRYDGTVEVYSPFSLLPIGVVQAGAGVAYMTIDKEGNNLCMVVPEKRTLVIADLVSKKVIAEMDVGDGPAWVSMMGER